MRAPLAILGHSLGGKVALSMLARLAEEAAPLPKQVRRPAPAVLYCQAPAVPPDLCCTVLRHVHTPSADPLPPRAQVWVIDAAAGETPTSSFALLLGMLGGLAALQQPLDSLDPVKQAVADVGLPEREPGCRFCVHDT